MTSHDESWWTNILAGPGGTLHASHSLETYVLLPRASEPRVVVDPTSSSAMRDAVDRFIGNRAGAAAGPLAGGASAVLSRRRAGWSVSSDERTLREHLGDILGTEVRLSVAVGPPRPNLKPIVRCYSGSELVAVAKMGPDSHTAEMVNNEGEWLARFANEPFGDVVTPVVLHRGKFGASELMVMAPFDTEGASSIPLSEVPLDLTRSLSEQFGQPGPVASGPWWKRLRERLDVGELERFAAIADVLSGDEDFLSIEGSMWHGDWSPWNIGLGRDQRHVIWDWERAEVGAPTGFDLLHLHYQYGDGLDDAIPDLGRLGVDPRTHRTLSIVYFLELAARHHEAGALKTERQAAVEEHIAGLCPDWLRG